MAETILEQVQADTREAMKAGERDRVAALRLVADALQKDAKEGGDDEVAVLRRERKRRLEAAEAYRDGGSDERAEAEEAEAREIERYLPAEMSDDELAALVDEAIAESGAEAPGDMGKVMGAADAEGRRPRRRQAGQRRGARDGSRPSLARRQLTLDNTIAAELAGSEDTVLRELEERLGCELFLRGNVLTLDGDDADVRRAATMVDELVGLVERGHDLAPATIETVTGAIDGRRRSPAEILEDVIWRHRGDQGGAEDRQPEALHGLDPRPHGHLRDRPGGHRQDLPRGRDGGRRARGAQRQPDHPHPARGRGRRAARLPARRHPGEGRPVPAPALRRALRHARPGEGAHLLRPRDDRGRAAGVHAGPDAQ